LIPRSDILRGMKLSQLPLFLQGKLKKAVRQQTVEPVTPTADNTVMQTLPAYMAFLGGSGYSASTTEKYFADVRRLSLFLREKKIEEITQHDIQQWIAGLLAKDGERLDPKTVNRMVSAIINYFGWLSGLGVIEQDPTATLVNARTQSPLPDYLYEDEIKTVYAGASKDIRIYLLVLLFLEAGIKSSELFTLTKAHIDISDPYNPEIWVKHSGKQSKKDRKVALPAQFSEVYRKYIEQYSVDEKIFPYTDRFVQMLFADLKKQTGIAKELTPKTLRHTHVVRAYKRGEDPDRIFERIGLAPDSRKEADEVYSRLARKGI
jgi:integrase/recombinase XerD